MANGIVSAGETQSIQITIPYIHLLWVAAGLFSPSCMSHSALSVQHQCSWCQWECASGGASLHAMGFWVNTCHANGLLYKHQYLCVKVDAATSVSSKRRERERAIWHAWASRACVCLCVRKWQRQLFHIWSSRRFDVTAAKSHPSLTTCGHMCWHEPWFCLFASDVRPVLAFARRKYSNLFISVTSVYLSIKFVWV